MKYDNVIVKYNSVLGRFNPFKRPRGSRFAARVLGNTIHVSCTKDCLLRRQNGNFVHSDFMTHELTHIEQVRRDGALWFYSKYLYEYLRNLIKTKDTYQAYLDISYEVEARQKERRDITSDELVPFLKGM